MLGRVHNLRRAAAMSLRALASAEASCSGRLFQGWGAGELVSNDAHSTMHSVRLGWNTPAPINSRLLSSLEQAEVPEPRQATYYVEVITGDVRGAGSAAPAAITLFGEGKNLLNFNIIHIKSFGPHASHSIALTFLFLNDFCFLL